MIVRAQSELLHFRACIQGRRAPEAWERESTSTLTDTRQEDKLRILTNAHWRMKHRYTPRQKMKTSRNRTMKNGKNYYNNIRGSASIRPQTRFYASYTSHEIFYHIIYSLVLMKSNLFDISYTHYKKYYNYVDWSYIDILAVYIKLNHIFV